MARKETKRRKGDDPREQFVTFSVPLKRPVYDRLRAMADSDHRRMSEYGRLLILDGMERKQAVASR